MSSNSSYFKSKQQKIALKHFLLHYNIIDIKNYFEHHSQTGRPKSDFSKVANDG